MAQINFENEIQNNDAEVPARQIQVRIIQIPPSNRAQSSTSQIYAPDPADLLLHGNVATANILREAASLPTTVITRDIRLPQSSDSTIIHRVPDEPVERLDQTLDLSSGGEITTDHSTCQCHVMQMSDNTVLWFVVNDVNLTRHESAGVSGRTSTTPENTSARSAVSGPFCRICFMGAEEGPLMRVCHCRGTVGLVHHNCVLLWTLQRQSYTCEICRYSYNLQVHGLRWCWQWIYPVPRGQIATQLLLFCMSWIVMVFSIASLIFISFNLRTLFPDDITAGVFIIMNSFTLLCSVGILLTQSMYPIRSLCQRFCLANLDIEILPYNESIDRRPTRASSCRQSGTCRQTGTPPQNQQQQSHSSPTLSRNPSTATRQHLMSIPSIQVNEMVRSNQAVLGSLQTSENIAPQSQQQRPQQVRQNNRHRFCSIL